MTGYDSNGNIAHFPIHYEEVESIVINEERNIIYVGARRLTFQARELMMDTYQRICDWCESMSTPPRLPSPEIPMSENIPDFYETEECKKLLSIPALSSSLPSSKKPKVITIEDCKTGEKTSLSSLLRQTSRRSPSQAREQGESKSFAEKLKNNRTEEEYKRRK